METKLKPVVIKTELGWEPAFWSGAEYVIEPGFALPTRQQAWAKLKADLTQSRQDDAASRAYQCGYDHACGYHD